MRKLLFIICAAAAWPGALRAQEGGDFGAGIIIGNPTGITAKFWLDGNRALDGGIGFGSHVRLYGDYLWHSWTALPRPANGKLPLHLGLGAQIKDSPDGKLGLRAVGGLAYWFPRHPVEIFAEIVPVLYISADDSLDLTGSAGVRYYFSW